MSLSDITIEEWQERFVRSQQFITTGNEILGGAFPRPPDLFDGFLLQNTLNLLAAEPHAGKTLLCLHLASSLASGTPLFGTFPCPPKRVLFIGQDSGSWDMAEQLRKLSRGHGITDLSNLDLRLNQGVNLFDAAFLKHLEEYHEHVGFDVLIFDTLRDVHRADENSSGEMGAVMQILKTMRDNFACTIFITHHIRKPQHDSSSSEVYAGRGSTVIPGTIDIQLNLSRKGTEITITLPKGRGLRKTQRQELCVVIDESEVPSQVRLSLDGTTLSPEEEIILSLLPNSRGGLIEITVIPPGKVDSILRTLARANLVHSPTRGVYERRTA